MLGIPLIVLTLLAGRGIGHLQRARARALLGLVVTPVPPGHPTGFWRRLLDPRDWRAILYGLLLFPVGVVTGAVTRAGWAAMLAGLTYSLYSLWLPESGLLVGETHVGDVLADLVAVAGGVLLLVVLPRLVRVLARFDAALVRGLLR